MLILAAVALEALLALNRWMEVKISQPEFFCQLLWYYSAASLHLPRFNANFAEKYLRG